MAQKTNWTLESIKVHPINLDKLNNLIAKIEPDGEVRGTPAIVFSPKLAVLDNECVGNDITNKVTFNIWRKDIDLGNGKHSGEIFPRWQITFTLDEIRPLLDPEMSLDAFMGERKDYNSRIRGNQQAWLNHFNS